MANCCIRFSFSFLNAISTHSHVCLCHLHATIDAVAVAVGDAVAPWISSCFRTMLLLFLLLLLVVVVLLLASFLQHCSIRTPILRLFSNSLRCLLSLGILLLLVAHPFPYQDSPAPPTQLLPHHKLPLIHFPQLLQATWKLGKWGKLLIIIPFPRTLDFCRRRTFRIPFACLGGEFRVSICIMMRGFQDLLLSVSRCVSL